MEKRYFEQQKVPDSRCGQLQFHPCEVRNWKGLVQGLKNKPFLEQLTTVNDYANAYPYIQDMVNWGVEDFWETPFEFLEVSGNCKDYAITKYYSLRMLGISSERLRVIVLQDLNLGGIIHAVLGVYEGDTLYILDNQAPSVMKASSIYHYVPIFSINETSWWRYVPR